MTKNKEEAPLENEEPAVDTEKEMVGEEVTILETDLAKLTNDAKDFKDKYLRLLADMENQRKRLQKEREDLMRFAKRDLILELLNPIDHLENALNHSNHANDEVKHWAMGFKMICEQFKEVLANHDILPFDSIGHEFDPHLHDAVETIETDEAKEDTVVEQILKGYKMGDRVIRPARVKIAKLPATEKEEDK